MSEQGTAVHVLTNGIRIALGMVGLVALVVGALVLIAPLKTASIIAAIIAMYAIVSGLVYAGIGIFSTGLGSWARIGNTILGVLFVIAGIVAFSDLGNATVLLAGVVAIFIGITWIIEGIVALLTLHKTPNMGWAAVYAVVSLIAGIVVIVAPFTAARLLWLFLGVSLIVLGLVQVVRAFSLKPVAAVQVVRGEIV